MVYRYHFFNRLFEDAYEGCEPADIARCYFDNVYSRGWFLEALGCWVQRISYGMDGGRGTFGDMDDPCEEFHFEGVEIEVGFSDPPDMITIDEATFFRWLRMTCERYVLKHPEDRKKVEDLLAQAPM